MRKILILISSVLLVIMGYLIEDRGLAMQVTDGGAILYPVSSGSEDGSILKLGLFFFIISAIYALVSLYRKSSDRILFTVYSINSLIYTFLLFLVMLDSSLLESARLGDTLPLVATILWILSLVLYGVLSLSHYYRSAS